MRATALLAKFFPISLVEVPRLDDVSNQILYHLPDPEELALERREL
jgi:hypothetical protein